MMALLPFQTYFFGKSIPYLADTGLRRVCLILFAQEELIR